MRPFAFLPVLALLLHAAPVAANDENRIVALNLKASGVPQGLIDNLSELLVSELRAANPKATVLGQSDIKAMLALEQEKATFGCDDTSCLAEIGGALGAAYLVTGRLGKVGRTYLVNIKLIYAPGARVERQVAERVTGKEEELIECIAQGARYLMDGKSAVGGGYVEVNRAGVVYIDGKKMGASPDRFPATKGLHKVSVHDLSGTELVAGEVSVKSFQTSVFDAVASRPAPVAKPVASTTAVVDGDDGGSSALVWALVAVGVLAVAGGVYYVLSQGDDGSSSNGETVGGTVDLTITPPAQ